MSRLLTISGSLRAGSSNAALLDAAARLAPVDVMVSTYAGIAALPAFSPDIEEGPGGLPAAVAHWRAALAAADAVLISSPEYAHGIPGALKNALDWAVGGSEMVAKPVGLLSASAASRFAHPQLVEVLTTMSAAVVPAASVVLDIPRRGADAARLVADPVLGPALRNVVRALLAAAAPAVGEGSSATSRTTSSPRRSC